MNTMRRVVTDWRFLLALYVIGTIAVLKTPSGWLSYVWCAVFAAATYLSIKQTILANADRIAELHDAEGSEARRWVALEFLVTGLLGCFARVAFFLGGVLVILGRYPLIRRTIAYYWPQVLLLAAVYLLTINIWQVYAARKLRRIMR